MTDKKQIRSAYFPTEKLKDIEANTTRALNGFKKQLSKKRNEANRITVRIKKKLNQLSIWRTKQYKYTTKEVKSKTSVIHVNARIVNLRRQADNICRLEKEIRELKQKLSNINREIAEISHIITMF